MVFAFSKCGMFAGEISGGDSWEKCARVKCEIVYSVIVSVKCKCDLVQSECKCKVWS